MRVSAGIVPVVAWKLSGDTSYRATGNIPAVTRTTRNSFSCGQPAVPHGGGKVEAATALHRGMTKPRNPTEKTEDGRFKPGNPGKPKGARSKATLAAEALLDGEAEKLTRVAIDKALEGDPVAMRLCLERLVPPRKDRPLAFNLPPVGGAKDHPAVLGAVLDAVAGGDLTPSEGQAFAALMEQHRRAIETAEIVERLEALEARGAK